jgi:hypothetical protein
MEQNRCDQHKYLQFTIKHVEVSNIVDHGAVALKPGTTWNSRSGDFVWEIARPEIGEETISKNCPFCEKKLEIKVDSLSEIASNRRKNRRAAKIGAIAAPIFAAGIYFAATATNVGNLNVVVMIVCIIGLIVCLLTLLELTMDRPGYIVTGELHEVKVIGPYNQHYIESRESHN